MTDLCASSLSEIVRGELHLSCLPPLGGAWEPVHAIRLDASHIRPGDVLLTGAGLDERVVGRRQYAEEAFARQAIGIVTSHRATEPWAGTFTIRVANARAALLDLAQWYRQSHQGTLITLLGSVRGERLADSLEILLSELGTVQRIEFGLPYDTVAVSSKFLSMHADSDYILTTVPVDDAETAALASQLLRPDIAINCLRQPRYAEVASIREVRTNMAPGSQLLTATYLPPLNTADVLAGRVVNISTQNTGDINFRIDTQGSNPSLLRLQDVVFPTRTANASLEDDMLLLATSLVLGMSEAQLQDAWQQLIKPMGQRHAA